MINRELTIETGLAYLTQDGAEFTMIGSKDFTADHNYIKCQQKLHQLIEDGKYRMVSTEIGQIVRSTITGKEFGIEGNEVFNLWDLTDGEIDQRPYLQWTVGRFPLENGIYSNSFLSKRWDEYITALEELTTNAIEHGSDNCQTGPVNIQCTATRKGVLITLIQPKPGPSQDVITNTKPGQNYKYQPKPTTNPKYWRGNGRTWIATTDFEVNYVQSETGGAITILLVKVQN